jgi:hypothetical protein
LIATASGTSSGRSRQLKSILGEITITEKQAEALEVKAHTQVSPYLEKCCLLVSANVFYERTTQDILVLTRIKVSRGTQQRLVHRQTFELPIVEDTVEEMSIDGGKVRIRTPKGEICRRQDLHCCQAGTYTIRKPSCKTTKSSWTG